MADPTNRDDLPDIAPIHRLVRATARLLRSSWVATGLAVTAGLLAAALTVAGVLDVLAPLPTWLRAVALAMVVIPATWALAVGVIRPLFRRLRPKQVARKIERKIPAIHNRLVSCLDLETAAAAANRSPAFYRKLVTEALERIKGFRPRSVLDLPALGRASLFAGASLAALAIAFLAFSEGLPTALARVFSPFADIPPATGVTFRVEPGDASVLRGEDIRFVARVEKGEPARLRLELRPEGGETLWHDLRKPAEGGRAWALALSGLEAPFTYRVHGGGTWSPLYRVKIVERPRVVGIQATYHYPDYMGIPEPRVGPPQVADVTGPQGGTVEVAVRAEGDVAEGEIQHLAARTSLVEVKERPERIWYQERTPDGAGLEGNWQWDFRLLARPAHTEPPAAGVHQHAFNNAPAGFKVRPGEDLFAYVWIKPDQKPEAIMLQWNDGAGWEHRAYWGEEKIPNGQPNTASRHPMGPLPPAGEWVRLEVPAAAVGLAGGTIRGMAFTLSGGQCIWHRAGALPSAHKERQELVVASRTPMTSAGQGRWAGRFPLDRDGLYRVELRNELKYANKSMAPGRLTATPDNPPTVALERPGTDLVLSAPAKVPLVISARDDFGLADVTLATQVGDSGGFVGRPVRRYETPARSENFVATIDLTALGVGVGQHVRYRVEARDRKGQTAQTQEFVVRVANDANAADKALETLDKTEDTFRENLVKLIGEQAKVRESVAAMAAKYQPLEEKIRAAEAKAQPKPDAVGPNADAPKAPQLDPEDSKKLAELREELAKLAAKEEQNAALGKQVADDLAKAAEQAAANQLLPPRLADAMREVPRALQEHAVRPMNDLAGMMKQGADPAKPAPDLDAARQVGDRVQAELEAAKAKLDALDKARGDLRQDPAQAVADLDRELLKQQAGMSERDLKELQDFLKAMAAELERLKAEGVQLADAAAKVPDVMVPDLERRQAEFEAKADPKLDEARELLKNSKARRKPDPDFPAAPYVPEDREDTAPPKESDADEPAKADAKDANPGEDKKDAEAKTEDEDLFHPSLGGPKPKIDPRFADKVRPEPEKAEGNHPPEADHREELDARQEHKLREISTAKQSVDSDREALDRMMAQLEAAAQAGDQEAAHRLNDLIKTRAMRQARSMAARMQQLRATPRPNRSQPSNPAQPNGEATASQPRTDPGVMAPEAILRELDPAAQAAILKLQPQVREELLQGLREEGPEGYRAYIRDYFGKLTRVKGPQ